MSALRPAGEDLGLAVSHRRSHKDDLAVDSLDTSAPTIPGPNVL